MIPALLACCLQAPPAGGAAGAAPVPRAEAIRMAGEWLAANQNPDGSWGGHQSPRPIEVLCDVPGSHQAFRVSTTALCVLALAEHPRPGAALRAALDRGVDALLAEHEVKRPSGFEHYNVWPYGFGLHALGEHLLRHPEDPRAPRIRAACAWMVEKLGVFQCLDGGWGYLSLDEVATRRPSGTSMSFTTATCLIGLERARRAGAVVPEPMIARAAAAIERCRTPGGAFTYGELWRRSPLMGVNQPAGAACRGPVCLEALALVGRDLGAAAQRAALERLLVDHPGMQVAGLRRPWPHESHFQISGYFYLYGHAYAALLLERLPEADRRRFTPRLEAALLRCRQPDGSFWDYPLYSYHKAYGTAFALLALSKLERLRAAGG